MLWALASSAFVIYLYQKLDAEGAVEPTDALSASHVTAPSTSHMSPIDMELASLNELISALESKLSKV
jgi:hypothetical protein